MPVGRTLVKMTDEMKETLETENTIKCKPNLDKHDGAEKEPRCRRQRVMVFCI